MLNIHIATTKEQKECVYAIRRKVFVEEQHVPLNLEIDQHEHEAVHFLCLLNNQPVGTSRLRYINHYGKLERICILQQYRGQSYGKQLIKRMEEEIFKQGISIAILHAQTHAKHFYEQLGYQVNSEPFKDAGIL